MDVVALDSDLSMLVSKQASRVFVTHGGASRRWRSAVVFRLPSTIGQTRIADIRGLDSSHRTISVPAHGNTARSLAVFPLSKADVIFLSMAKSVPNDIHQFSLLSAFNGGLKDGGPPVGFLVQQGTHGIGICEDDEGDMIQLDSVVYTFEEDGEAVRADKEDQMPFVLVTAFQPSQKAKLPKGTASKKVKEVFERGKNSPMPFRITGKFQYISTKQETYWDVVGTIFGFYLPSWQRDISGEGVQCCYLSEDKKRGGRVADFETGDGAVLEWAKCGRLHLGFPKDEEFQQVRLRRASVSEF